MAPAVPWTETETLMRGATNLIGVQKTHTHMRSRRAAARLSASGEMAERKKEGSERQKQGLAAESALLLHRKRSGFEVGNRHCQAPDKALSAARRPLHAGTT